MSSLVRRLLKSSLLIALPPVIASGAVGTLLALAQIESGLTDRVLAGSRGASLALSAIESGIRIRANAAVRTSALEGSLRANDRLATLDWAERAIPVLGVDRVTIAGLDGRVIARGHLPTSYADHVNGPMLASAGIGHGEGGLSIRATVPIRALNDTPLGFLLVEKTIDYALLLDLKRQFGLDFSVWDGDRLQATTLTTREALLDARTAQQQGLGAREVRVGERQYFGGARLHPEIASGPSELMVSLRRDAAIGLVRQLTWFNALVVFCIAALTAAGAWFAAKRIVEPIRRLVRATDAAASGKLDVAVDVHQSDELGELAAAFRSMFERRAEVERELRETQAELERRVVVRTEELRRSEEHLQRARKLEALGRLAGGIAHDFNNVLTVILGNNELVLDALAAGRAGRETSEASQEIKKSAEHAAALTQQLLTFSRAQVAELRVLDLSQTLHDLERMLRRLVAEDVTLELSLARDLAKIRADTAQIGQVVVNLVINAGDALPKGGAIRIRAFNRVVEPSEAESNPGVPAGSFVVLEVEDTGTGMDSATIERMFEPFFTTKPLGKGTGMGLAIVHGILQLTGANLTVVSSPGAGTTFRILFPVVDDDADEAEPASMPRSTELAGHTLLLCEDEPPVRSLIARMLKSGGYNVLVAESAERALALAEEQQGVALLVTDVVMPGMNGVELARILRSRIPRLQVLYLSGYTSDVLDTRADLDMRGDLLEKPVTREPLLRKVDTMLARRRPGESKDDAGNER